MPISQRRSVRPKLFGDSEQKILKEIIDKNNKISTDTLQKSFNKTASMMVGQPDIKFMKGFRV